jgi:flagellar hook-associated protein 1 FlgK
VGNGRPLVDGETAGSLAVQVGSGSVYDVKIFLPGQNILVSVPDTITGDIASGELAAAIRFRDGYINTVRDRVDQLAYAISTQVNDQHVQGYDLDGNLGDLFFTDLSAGGGAGAAHDFRVAASITSGLRLIAAASPPPPALPGDNRNSVLMAGLRNISIAGDISVAGLGGATIPDFIAGMVGQIGSETKGADLDLRHQKVVVNYLETRREEVSGVSLDEEMTNLIRFQRAFEAATRMISVLDGLLDDVLNLKK